VPLFLPERVTGCCILVSFIFNELLIFRFAPSNTDATREIVIVLFVFLKKRAAEKRTYDDGFQPESSRLMSA
jgi:accessory gene regulator protein AgrB